VPCVVEREHKWSREVDHKYKILPLSMGPPHALLRCDLVPNNESPDC